MLPAKGGVQIDHKAMFAARRVVEMSAIAVTGK